MGMLILIITKKTYLMDIEPPSLMAIPFKLALSQVQAQAAIESLARTEDQSSFSGTYDPVAKIATITFTNVVEYNKSVTPPNVMNPNLKLFGSMPTAIHKSSSKKAFILPGGIRPITYLYGIIQEPTVKNRSINIKQSDLSLKSYNKESKTAILKNGSTYVGIVEYNQATTPPNILNSSLKAFATIDTPNYKESGILLGSVRAITTLYGIPVFGKKIAVKQDSKSIGYYWPESNVAQLNNGITFMQVVTEKIGNYKPSASDSAFLNAKRILNSHTQTTSIFKSKGELIGTAKLSHQNTISLYGAPISLNISQPHTAQNTFDRFAKRRVDQATNNPENLKQIESMVLPGMAAAAYRQKRVSDSW